MRTEVRASASYAKITWAIMPNFWQMFIRQKLRGWLFLELKSLYLLTLRPKSPTYDRPFEFIANL